MSDDLKKTGIQEMSAFARKYPVITGMVVAWALLITGLQVGEYFRDERIAAILLACIEKSS